MDSGTWKLVGHGHDNRRRAEREECRVWSSRMNVTCFAVSKQLKEYIAVMHIVHEVCFWKNEICF